MQQESTGGLLIITAALLAMGVENSPLKFLYDALLDTPVGIQFGASGYLFEVLTNEIKGLALNMQLHKKATL